MRSLEIYKPKYVSRKWFTDNWGKGRYVNGYPYDHHKTLDNRTRSHPGWLAPTRCEAWKVLGVGT